MEQLIAESSGKTGKGIIPVDGEPVMSAKYYQQDRLFVYLKHTGAFQEVVNEFQKVNQPVLTLNMPDGYALGTEMFTWEYATAIACAILGVNAFDQPDVQDSKTRTQHKIKSFIENGSLVEQQPAWEDSNYAVFPSNVELGSCQTVDEYVTAFLRNAKPTDYIAINAYVPRDPAYTSQLQHFRKQVMQLAGCTTTLGFGPRFLHSTGQLHKGGPDNCLVIQITLDFANQDLKIPGKPFTFGTLQAAQAQGDLEALQAHNRKILRLHLKSGAFPELFY